ncbi:hypothetical protein G7Y89_g15153 [Cudoniella acicularis]|uniref:Uncharacterized protein n=1 Tax=Cudoniella acicularis TaxID=354080 RepID=A0A8H4QS88_9HELO|nr:hypothetical protein G7Y89_g15153 [Cudoniella acicularis]
MHPRSLGMTASGAVRYPVPVAQQMQSVYSQVFPGTLRMDLRTRHHMASTADSVRPTRKQGHGKASVGIWTPPIYPRPYGPSYTIIAAQILEDIKRQAASDWSYPLPLTPHPVSRRHPGVPPFFAPSSTRMPLCLLKSS